MTRAWAALTLLMVTAFARDAGAQLPVLGGDPIDPSTGAAYIILPGVPLVHPGGDGKYDTADDLIDAGIVGDVDLVIRTGGGYAGGPIPGPHASVAAAPAVTVGGTATATGNEVAFQGILSDGQPPFATGNPLTGPELNGRPVLAIAYGDLDGDGVIGPTAVDGDADDEIERQEVLPIGRQAAAIVNGVATGSLALSVGAPASAGGLGVVVTGGASTGTTPYLYFDGPWIATRLPYMPPLDPDRIVGSSGIGGPDPSSLLTDFELEIEKTFSPAPNHPILGTPYAIPLDGTSPTVDLLRSESGDASGVAFGRPVDPATFVADPSRRVHPAVGPGGSRALLEEVEPLGLASDGPGGAAALDCFITDRLGNPADPPPGGYAVTLEAGPRLRIVSPDTDGNTQVEPLTFTSAAAAVIIVDDAGLPTPTPVVDRVVAVRSGVPVGALRVALAGGGGPGAGGLGESRVQMRFSRDPVRGQLTVATLFDAGATPIDPSAQAVTIDVAASGTSIYTRTLTPGTLTSNGARTAFRFRDPATFGPGRIRRLSIRRSGGISASAYTLRLRVRPADLTAALPAASAVTGSVTVGGSGFVGDLACASNGTGSVTTCVR